MLVKKKNTRMRATPHRVIISGIGTGGHYYPAIVTGLELQRRGCDVIVLIRRGYQEEKIAGQYGLRTYSIRSRPFFGKSFLAKLLFAATLVHSIFKLHALTRHSIGLAFGGFGAVPLNISCILNRSAFYVFEPNRVPGRATRFFAHSARRIFLGLPPVASMNGNTSITGIPVRVEFKTKLGAAVRRRRRGEVRILVYGGSQGARALNDMALALQDIIPRKWCMTIISGVGDYPRVARGKKTSTRVIPFTDTPWEEIRQSDVLISRAGALAGYEILAFGKKVIFVPFPYAIDDHQYHNALYFADTGDALVREEKDVTTEELAKDIRELLRKRVHKKPRLIMDAERQIADFVLGDIEHEK